MRKSKLQTEYPEGFAILRDRLRLLERDTPFTTYYRAGLTERRWRWDLFHRTGITIGSGETCPGKLDGVEDARFDWYATCNDDHVDTALRRTLFDLTIGG